MQQTEAAGQARLVWRIGGLGQLGEGGGDALWRRHPGADRAACAESGHQTENWIGFSIGRHGEDEHMSSRRASSMAPTSHAAAVPLQKNRRQSISLAARSPADPHSHQIVEMIGSRIGDRGTWYAT